MSVTPEYRQTGGTRHPSSEGRPSWGGQAFSCACRYARQRRLDGFVLVLLTGCVVASVAAQPQPTRTIYTCIDSQGRRLTADRPIPECLDRQQLRLDGSGLVRGVRPPSYTAEERAQIDAQRRAEQEQRARLAEEQRRDRALLMRYPGQASHDRDRAEALAQIDELLQALNRRGQTLLRQRQEMDTELEFYQGDVAKAPLWLRRKLEDNGQQQLMQKRFLDEQVQEKKRISARFDEELVRLRRLWGEPVAR